MWTAGFRWMLLREGEVVVFLVELMEGYVGCGSLHVHQIGLFVVLIVLNRCAGISYEH